MDIVTGAIAAFAILAMIIAMVARAYRRERQREEVERMAGASFGPDTPHAARPTILDPIQDVTGDMPEPDRRKAELIQLHERKTNLYYGARGSVYLPPRPNRWHAPRLVTPIRQEWAS